MIGGTVFLLWAGTLAAYDLRSRRLPDWLTLPAVPVVWAVAVGTGQWWSVIGGLAWFLLCVLPGRCSTRLRTGGGDAKLALSLGCVAAMAGQVPGVLFAVFIASLVTLGLLAAPRVRRRGSDDLPHGPGMLIGTAVVVTPVITAGWW